MIIVTRVRGPVTAKYIQKRWLVTLLIDGSDQLKSGMEKIVCAVVSKTVLTRGWREWVYDDKWPWKEKCGQNCDDYHG